MEDVNLSNLLLATILLGIAPLLLGVATCYLKVSIVLGALKNALGSQQLPGPMLVTVLSLCISYSVMRPVIDEVVSQLPSQKEIATQSQNQSEVPGEGQLEMLLPALLPWQKFLASNAGGAELHTLCNLGDTNHCVRSVGKESVEDALPEVERDKSDASAAGATRKIPLSVLLPAFLLSEVKAGFSMAFILLLPFVVIDLLVAILLSGLNMQMVSPLMVSFPLKLLVFVMSDAWVLLYEALYLSYQSG